MKLIIHLILFVGFFLNTHAQDLVIENNSFQKDLEGWTFRTSKDKSKKNAIADFKIWEDGQDNSPCSKITVVVTTPSKKTASVSVERKLPTLKKNKTYEISFYIKSNTFNDLVGIKFCGKNKNKPNEKVRKVSSKAAFIDFKGDRTWQKITYNIKAISNSKIPMNLSDCSIKILKGNRTGVTYIDNFTIKQVK